MKKLILLAAAVAVTIGCGGGASPKDSGPDRSDALSSGSGGASGTGTGGTGTGGSAGQGGSAGRDAAPANDAQSMDRPDATDRPDVGGSEAASLDGSSEAPSSVTDGSDTTPKADGGVDSGAGDSSQGDGSDAQSMPDGGGGGTSLSPGTYAVNVTRDAQDLYAVTGQSMWIKTQFCFEFVFYDAATLVWNGKFFVSNKITFSSGKSCDVVDVFVGERPDAG